MNQNGKDANYPVQSSTLASFEAKILSSVKAGECITFSFSPYMGGSRAWVKFLIKDKKIGFAKSMPEREFVCIEPVECIETSNLAFFYLILEKLINKRLIKKYEDYSLSEIVSKIKDCIAKSKKPFVIFLLKLDSYPNLNPVIGNLLYSIWKDNKDKISFVTTLSTNMHESDLLEKLGSFSECLTNHLELDRLSDADISQSIIHWSAKLNYAFDSSESKAIIKYSEGLPMISKMLCQRLSKNEDKKDTNKVCKEAVEQLLIQSGGDKLRLLDGGLIYLNITNISQRLSYQEFSVLKLLLENTGKVVNRDDLADALWQGKAFEKYSDWAIDKFISLIRNKLKALRFSGEIKSKKGQGFILIQ